MNMRNGQRPADLIDVVVVGAGQAGLAVSYYLRAFGVEHIVLERGQIGENWRSARWDSFTLVTPNWMTRLPGHLLAAGTGADFLPRDGVLAMLEQFAHGLPVRAGVEVVSVTAGDRGYQVVTPGGIVAARAVVIAGGGQRSPVIPAVAGRLPAELHQCHAGDYRSPARCRRAPFWWWAAASQARR
jgi:putative flavoprotein involved in K+ transport